MALRQASAAVIFNLLTRGYQSHLVLLLSPVLQKRGVGGVIHCCIRQVSSRTCNISKESEPPLLSAVFPTEVCNVSSSSPLILSVWNEDKLVIRGSLEKNSLSSLPLAHLLMTGGGGGGGLGEHGSCALDLSLPGTVGLRHRSIW